MLTHYYLPLIVAAVGLAIFLFMRPKPDQPERSNMAEAGRLAFAVGLLAFLLKG